MHQDRLSVILDLVRLSQIQAEAAAKLYHGGH